MLLISCRIEKVFSVAENQIKPLMLRLRPLIMSMSVLIKVGEKVIKMLEMAPLLVERDSLSGQ